MKLAELKQEVFLPDRVSFINQFFTVRGQFALAIALTQQEHKTSFWVLYHRPLPDCLRNEPKDSEPLFSTQREQLLYQMKSNQLKNICIESMTVQNKPLQFVSGGLFPLLTEQPIRMMQFQYFMEKGLVTTPLDDCSLSDLCLAQFESAEYSCFPEIDECKPLDIVLDISAESNEIAIFQTHVLNFGEHSPKQIFTFTDDAGKEQRYTIHALKTLDCRQELTDGLNEQSVSKMRKQGSSDAEIEEMKNQARNHLDPICPEGHILAMVEYETSSDIKLRFYTEDELNSPPEYRCSVTGITVLADDGSSADESNKQYDVLTKPIKKGCTQPIKIGMLSYSTSIPKETIHL